MKYKSKTSIWDASEYLETKKDMVAYLSAALEENDPSLISAALGDITKAKGMTQIANQTGLGRESLYKALSSEENPEFATVLKGMNALGMHFYASLSHETNS